MFRDSFNWEYSNITLSVTLRHALEEISGLFRVFLPPPHVAQYVRIAQECCINHFWSLQSDYNIGGTVSTSELCRPLSSHCFL